MTRLMHGLDTGAEEAAADNDEQIDKEIDLTWGVRIPMRDGVEARMSKGISTSAVERLHIAACSSKGSSG